MENNGGDTPLSKDEVRASEVAGPPRLFFTRRLINWIQYGFFPLLWSFTWATLIAVIWVAFMAHVISDAAEWAWSLWPIW